MRNPRPPSPVVQAAFNEGDRRTVGGVLSTERDKVMQGEVLKRQDDEAKAFGIEIVDVRIKRVDFAADITESVYRRMESERKRVANELRSTGAAEGEKIRADADRQREVIVAEAYRDAQKIKGEGDAEASACTPGVWPRPAVRPVLPQPRGRLSRQLPATGDVMVGRSVVEFFGDARRLPAARRWPREEAGP